MAKVLLINPRDTYLENTGEPTNIGDRPPLGLLSISAYLKQYGHEVIFYDLNHYTPLQFPVEDTEPLFVCMSISTPNYNQALDLIKDFSQLKDFCVRIAGGNHVTDFPHQKETLEAFDYIVQGDGEQAVLDIIEGRISEEEKKKKIIKRELKDIDIIPDYEAVDMSKYTMQVDGLLGAVVVTARGCKYNCCYCGSAKHKKVRERSLKNVLEEVELLYNKHSRKGFYFGDDIFTFNKKRTLELCTNLKLFPGVKFRCTTRADLLDETIIQHLKGGGCSVISLGVESGSDAVLKAMHKGMNVNQQREAINLCKKYGIKVKSFYIFPLPGDTLETFEETLAFAKEMDTEFCDIYSLTPYPGTPLWEHPDRFGIEIYKPQSPEEWDEYNQIQVKKSKPLFKHPNLTQEQIEYCIRRFKEEIKPKGVTY